MSNITTEIQIDGQSSSSGSTNASLKIHQPGEGLAGSAGSASEDDNVSNNGSSSQKVTNIKVIGRS